MNIFKKNFKSTKIILQRESIGFAKIYLFLDTYLKNNLILIKSHHFIRRR
jgi:hypothetical protein